MFCFGKSSLCCYKSIHHSPYLQYNRSMSLSVKGGRGLQVGVARWQAREWEGERKNAAIFNVTTRCHRLLCKISEHYTLSTICS